MAGNFGSSQMMPAGVGDVSNGVSYTQGTDPYQSALTDFFGAQGNQTMVQAYSAFPTTNQQMPEAYEGRNLFLNDTIEGLILSENEVYTAILLRWLLTDQIHFTFNTFEFNQTLPGIVPHEGISRLITSSTKSQTFTSNRHGLAFRMEGDFADTAQGAAQYTRNLIQISQACQELANYGVELALLNCKDYVREWSAQFRERGTTYEKVRNDEAADFASCALEPGRIEIVIEKARAVLQARRIVADSVLLWPQAKLHFAMEMNGARTGYWRLGPDGIRTFEAGPDAMGVLRGNLAVFEGREFDVDVGGPRAQPLERSTYVGEVYGMLFGSRRNDSLGDATYSTSQRDIFIYDLPEDQYKRVSFEEAILESNVFENVAPHKPRPEFAEFAAELNTMSETDRLDNMNNYEKDIPVYNARLGESRSSRGSLPMFVYHNTLTKRYAVAETFGDLDYNVLTDKDVQQVADSITAAGALAAVQALSRAAAATLSRFGGAVHTQTPMGVDAGDVSVNVLRQSPLSVGGYAGILSGSMPLSESVNAMLHADVDATRGAVKASRDMKQNKFMAWLAESVASVSGSGKDSEAFETALGQRSAMLVDVAKGLNDASGSNILAVRRAFLAAFDKNLNADGKYSAKRSLDTLKADVQRVRESAKNMNGAAEDSAAGDLLKQAFDDTAKNPFATITSQSSGAAVRFDSTALSAAQQGRVSDSVKNFMMTSLHMEGRVLLHGAVVDGVEFSEDTANEWADAVERKATSASQKAAAAKTRQAVDGFVAERASLERIVEQTVSSALQGSGGQQPYGAFAHVKRAQQAGPRGAVDRFLFDGENTRAGASIRTDIPFTRGEEDAPGDSNQTRRRGKFAAGTAARAFLDAPLNGQTFLTMMQANIHLPVNILLFRLWIQLRMYTGILMRSGYETGASVYGHSNFAMGSEVATKTIYGNFTFYYNSIVWKERAVIHLRNICPRGYEGGWNTQFMETVEHDMYDTPVRSRGSLLAAMVPVTENNWVFPLNFVPTQTVISSRGDQLTYQDRIELFGSYSMAAYYKKLHGLQDSQHYSEVNSRYADEYDNLNTVAWMGAHFRYNATEKKFNDFKSGAGHLSGNRTGRGAKMIWEGNGRLFPEQNPNSYNLS